MNNVGNSTICKDLAMIERSFEKGEIYTIEWDKESHKLKKLKGLDLFTAKVKHFFASSYAEELRFLQVFHDCVRTLSRIFSKPTI